MTYSGEGNFVVRLLDSKGEKVGGSVANEIGAWSGTKAVNIPSTGKYVVDVGVRSWIRPTGGGWAPTERTSLRCREGRPVQDFKPDDLGEVKRPKRMRYCPRCQAQTPAENPACIACGIVFDRIKSEVTGVIRPVAPKIQPVKSGGGVLMTLGSWGSRGLVVMITRPSGRSLSLDVRPQRGHGWTTDRRARAAFTDPRPGGSPLTLPVNPPARPEPTPAVSALEAAEQQWRSRADAARADLAAAEAEVARVEASMGGPGIGVAASDQQAEQIRLNRTASARNRVESARARLNGLAEECRRSAGCAPGWVR
jgi:hypothetical protein